jgi:glycosyltransferase involved in cell wall biosynthesis
MGGIERALTNLADYFVNQNLDVVFVSCLQGKRFYVLDSRIKIIEPNFKRHGGPINKITFYFQLIKFIKSNYSQEQPSTVLSFGDVFNPLVLLALKNKNVPVYISDRTSPDYKFKFPTPFLKRWLYPKSAGFIAQTTRAADYKRKQFGDRLSIKVIPNALKEMSVSKQKRKNTILYVGRFAWEKAPHYLIEAFAQLKEINDWRLVMAGSGPLLPEMKLLAQELSVENRVEFLGDVKNVDQLYAKASIYVLPSVIEGFPNSLCEAMAAGLPAVCFNTIPHEDIFVNPEMGVICSDLSSQSLAKVIDRLIRDEAYRTTLGNNASKIKEHLDIKRIGSQYLDFMQLSTC